MLSFNACINTRQSTYSFLADGRCNNYGALRARIEVGVTRNCLYRVLSATENGNEVKSAYLYHKKRQNSCSMIW